MYCIDWRLSEQNLLSRPVINLERSRLVWHYHCNLSTFQEERRRLQDERGKLLRVLLEKAQLMRYGNIYFLTRYPDIGTNVTFVHTTSQKPLKTAFSK